MSDPLRGFAGAQRLFEEADFARAEMAARAYDAGYSYQEIADSIGTSKSWAWGLVKRGQAQRTASGYS